MVISGIQEWENSNAGAFDYGVLFGAKVHHFNYTISTITTRRIAHAAPLWGETPIG
jgi:hypothetical protein